MGDSLDLKHIFDNKTEIDISKADLLRIKDFIYSIRSVNDLNSIIEFRLVHFFYTKYVELPNKYSGRNNLNENDVLILDTEFITFRGKKFNYKTEYEAFVTFWEKEIENMTIDTFEGYLYHTQISQQISFIKYYDDATLRPFYSKDLEKPTFFCIKPELCVLGTTHRRFVEGKSWKPFFWFTFQTKQPLKLLKIDSITADTKFKTPYPEEILTKLARNRGCMGWMTKNRQDQFNMGEQEKMFEIAVFREYISNLKQIGEPKNELNFFEELYEDKPEVRILKIIRKPKKLYEEEIRHLRDDLTKQKKKTKELQEKLDRLGEKRKRKKMMFRFF
tara:strand:- start:162 stop:1157 length:996 start_codon:yes stop_codon:yes gene_type:complete